MLASNQMAWLTELHNAMRRPRRGAPITADLSSHARSFRSRVAAAALAQDGYSGHSLRSGFATSAARAGLTSWDIRRQTGHASVSTLEGYVRDAELFASLPFIL